MNFGPSEILTWVIVSLLLAAVLIFAFIKFMGRGRNAEKAGKEGIRHDGVRRE